MSGCVAKGRFGAGVRESTGDSSRTMVTLDDCFAERACFDGDVTQMAELR